MVKSVYDSMSSLEVINPKDSICTEDDTVPEGVAVRKEPVACSKFKICVVVEAV